MTLSTDFVVRFAELLTAALIHFVWQGAALALILLVTLKLLDVKTAQVRYLLSVAALLLMGAAPIVTAVWHHVGNPQPQALVERPRPPGAEQGAVNASNATPSIVPFLQRGSLNPRLEVHVLIVWLVGVFLFSARTAIGYGFTFWIRAQITPLSEEFERRVRMIGSKLHLDARRRVFICKRVAQAVAVGFVRPIVLVPASWLMQFSPETIEAVIAHELAHIRRWDLWVNLAQRIIETLLFFHPAVWWLSNRIRLEREMCCDEIAAECCDRVLYARSLESVAQVARGNLLVAASINGGGKMNLLNRIRHLLGVAPVDAGGNWWAVGIAAAALTMAAGVVSTLSRADTPTVARDESTVKVVTTNPQIKDVVLTEQYVARIQAIKSIKVRSLLQGQLQTISVAAGQDVKQGDVMFNLDPEPYRAKLDLAITEAMTAQQALDDAKKLTDDKAVSANELALLEEKLTKAQANVQLATAELTFTALQAPFEGTILSVDQKAGNQVQEGEVLGHLTDQSQMWVYFNVPETRYLEHAKELDKLNQLPVELILVNGQKFAHVGRIGAIEGQFNDKTGNIPFRADFPNPDRLLRHGMSGTVVVNRMLKGALVIPQRATFEILAKRYVYVVDKDDVARQREIVVQSEVDEFFVVKGGVGVDDRIIVEGIRQVHDGEQVEYEGP